MKTPATLAVVALLCGCHSAPKSSDSSRSPVLARLGSETITVADLQAKIAEQPTFLQARFQKPDARKQLLEDLIRFRLLTQEARAQGIDKDPKIQETFDKLLVQRLIQKKSEEHPQVTDADLKAYYDAHLSEFVRPAKIRVSQIFLAAAASSPTRAKVEAEAKHLLGEIHQKEAGPVKTEFAAVAGKRSDDLRSRGLSGDLGLITEEELKGQWGPEVAKAAFGLKKIGDTTEVASARGFHLLKLTARIPETNRSFETVKALLESRVALEQRAKSVDAFVASVKEKANVQVDQKALDAMSVTPAPKT